MIMQPSKILTLPGQHSRKNTVLDYFFHKSTKKVTSESDTAGKMGPTCCPTFRSTGLNPQLGVPVKYKAPTVRLFWFISAVLWFPEVKTSENFSRLW